MVDKPESENRGPSLKTRVGLRLGEPEHGLPDLDKVQAYLARDVSITRTGRVQLASLAGSEFWVNLFGFVILQVAIGIGWIAATGGRLNDGWSTVLIALAAAALGFGVAYLLARRSNESQSHELERDYKDLKERSARLSAAIEKFEKSSRPSESGVPGPAT